MPLECEDGTAQWKEMQFLFLRHGQTDWNLQKRLQGRLDLPLNETGIAQAETAAEYLSDDVIDVIFSSPLARALQTSELLSRRSGAPVRVEPKLVERSFGSLEGALLSSLLPEGCGRFDVAASEGWPEDAEPWQDVQDRAAAFLKARSADIRSTNVLLVAHLGIALAICDTLSVPRFAAENALPYRFCLHGKKWTVSESTVSG